MYVFKEFGVFILIGGNGDVLCIFYDGGIYNFLYGVVVAEVDDFSVWVLYDLVYDVDGGVVFVE